MPRLLPSLLLVLLVLLVLFAMSARAAEPLPDTKPLTEHGDLAAKMVAGMHKYLDRELAASPKKRDELWKANEKEPVAAKRERLRKILGVVDERVKPNLEYVGGPGRPSLLAEIDGCKVHAVRWAVLPGVDAEGFLIEPKGEPKANVVYLNSLGAGQANLPYDLTQAYHGCRVLVPTLINRDDDLSGNAKLKRQTNIPHREFVYRMAYEMGRTLTGYEVQKVLAAVDWFTQQSPKLPIGVIGYNDGGMIAFHAGALDDRIRTTGVWGYFAAREQAPRMADRPQRLGPTPGVRRCGNRPAVCHTRIALPPLPPAISVGRAGGSPRPRWWSTWQVLPNWEGWGFVANRVESDHRRTRQVACGQCPRRLLPWLSHGFRCLGQ